MRKILSLLAVLVLWTVFAFAQNRVITGQVKDDKGDPIPFASVTIKGTNKGTTTDANGNFRIEAKAGDVLLITAVGSKEREVAVGSSNTYNVALDKSGALQEVVVTALGVQKQPKELGYSVARVKNSELTQARVTNLQNGLVGKVSGLNISTVNNGVFANTRIVLRGIRSLTGNNQPLLVVDGSPISLDFINTINPNDVESVNILKGANSAALYGPEGVNGVIVVTTKKGTTGKNSVNLDAYYGWQQWFRFPKVLNNSYDYMYYLADAQINSFGSTGVTQEELIEMITHMAFYSGWPTAVTAAMRVREIFGETKS